MVIISVGLVVGSRSGRSSRGSSTDRSSSSLVIVESTPRGAIATKTRYFSLFCFCIVLLFALLHTAV